MTTVTVVATPDRAAGDGVVRGVTYAATAMLLYALMDACSKTLVAKFDPAMILSARTVLAFGLGIAMAFGARGMSGVRTAFRSVQPGLQLVRGFAALGSMYALVLALSMSPLAQVLSIVYAAPIAVTLLAIPILGDQVGVRRMSAVLVGFAGVLLVAQPGAQSSLGLPLAIASMLFYALSTVLTRRLGRTDSGLTTHIWTQLCFAVVCLPMLPFFWVTPDFGEAMILLGGALIGAIAMYLITLAHQTAPPAVVAPVDYTILIWSALLGFILWSEVPGSLAVLGMTIIVASGLYIAQREFMTSPLNRLGPVYLWARRHRG